tara:strand:- start:17816 stop:19600 length:1785 start_codon:yes stop_codon:yes gene_type:complete
MKKTFIFNLIILYLFASEMSFSQQHQERGVMGADDRTIEALIERGKTLYNSDIGCWVCHAESGEGLVGPTLLFGPSPSEIYFQLQSNALMDVIRTEMDPSDEDLVAMSMYIRTLANLEIDDGISIANGWRQELAAVKGSETDEQIFPRSARDEQIEAIETFESFANNWERRSKEGSVLTQYDSRVVATFDAGEQKFFPENGHTYFYENVGTNSSPSILYDGYVSPKSNQLVVGDAETLEVIGSYEFPESLRATVHTSAMSPDGKYAYFTGPREPSADGSPDPSGAQTMVKVDALTLQPISQITIGARLHHGQVFRGKMLFDMFHRDPGGPAVIIYDHETDEVVGAIRDIDMGGMVYTVWPDDDHKYIYALMEPTGYAPGRSSGMVGLVSLYQGELVAMRNFWVAKIDADTWEVVLEFPVPGYRPNWAVIDSKNEYVYVISGNSQACKHDANTGEVSWCNGTGIGPYGASLNADETELWVADKGEGAHHLGRTITVMDTDSGHATETLYGTYKVDHVLLSPNGKEMWSTSNGEGKLTVYDVDTKETLKIIDMPQNGDAHGMIWVHYDETGKSMVVRDQGNFHGGINPQKGVSLNY